MMWRLTVLLVAGFANAASAAPPRNRLSRDLESYAIAACLAGRPERELKAQGEGWASAIVQRGHGPIGPCRKVADVARDQALASGPAVIRNETSATGDQTLPIMTCVEIVEAPAVRTAITRATIRLAPFYGRR